MYFTRLATAELCMLLVVPKAAIDSLPSLIPKLIREEIEDEHSQEVP